MVYRGNGRSDRYCVSVHPLADTPCIHLATGGTRYLIFPQLGECCVCCTAAGGCGPLSPHWLDNATYQGEVQLRGMAARSWRAQVQTWEEGRRGCRGAGEEGAGKGGKGVSPVLAAWHFTRIPPQLMAALRGPAPSLSSPVACAEAQRTYSWQCRLHCCVV